MAWSERVLSGRPTARRDAWAGSPGTWRGVAGAVSPEPSAGGDPLAEEAVQARLADVAQAAEAHGYAAGRAQAEQELAAAVAAAHALGQKLETAVPRDVDMLARTVAELGVLIARRILGAELRHDPSVLVAAIEGGLRQAAGASVITVELHPMVVDSVEAVWTARHGARHRGFAWSFSGDPTLPPDGCRLRTEHSLVEAGFEDQLAEVAAALEAAIPGYLGAALGPAAAATEAAERRAFLAPETLPAGARVATPAAGARVATPAAGVPGPAALTASEPALLRAPEAPVRVASPGTSAAAGAPHPAAATALPDLDALAMLGLGDLDLDALASLGLDTGPGASA